MRLLLLPRSGVYNDLGSGSNVDLCIITAGGVEYLRNYEFLQAKTYSRVFPVKYPPGTAREWHAARSRLAAGRASATEAAHDSSYEVVGCAVLLNAMLGQHCLAWPAAATSFCLVQVRTASGWQKAAVVRVMHGAAQRLEHCLFQAFVLAAFV